jgi:cell division protein FtsL
MAVVNRTIARPQAKPAAPPLRLGQVLLIAGAAIAVIALLQVVQSSEATTASFKIQELEQQKLELETTVQQLAADVAALSSLERIEREAARLGLGAPAARQTVGVDVLWPGASADRLPSRFAPAAGEQAGADEQGSPWWRDLLGLLPFN